MVAIREMADFDRTASLTTRKRRDGCPGRVIVTERRRRGPGGAPPRERQVEEGLVLARRAGGEEAERPDVDPEDRDAGGRVARDRQERPVPAERDHEVDLRAH